MEARLTATVGAGALELGELADVGGVPVMVRASGFTRHTFVCRQSGSGKTYAMGKLLKRLLLDTELRIVIVDPNSDYVKLGKLLEPDAVGLDPEDYAIVRRRHDTYSDRVHVFGGDGGGLKLWLGNLTARQQVTVLGLGPIRDAEEVDLALRLVDDLGTTRYTPSDLSRLAGQSTEVAARLLRLHIQNTGLERMDIWADEDHPAVSDRLGEDWRALIMDLGSLRTAREQWIASAAVVSALWEQRRDRRPVLLVVDESHNLCPGRPTDPNQALATEHLIAIAAEGRKYGIYLMLATQRPAKIHENVLSQCDNLVLMRMNSERDIDFLASAFSAVPSSLIERAATFRLGEGLAYGKIAPDPLLFKTGRRVTPEGGTDVPTDWIHSQR